MLVRRGRRILDLWHAGFHRYELTRARYFARRAAREEARTFAALRALLEPFDGHRPAGPPARVRLIDRRLDTLCRWQPSERDLERLADVVNRRAGWPLLGHRRWG